MSTKKRKNGASNDGPPAKKSDSGKKPSTVNFSTLDIGEWQPIIYTAPGVQAPERISLNAYTRPADKVVPGDPSLNIFLHNEDTHPAVDYTMKEEKSGMACHTLEHYIGIYDPSTGDVKVVPARKMVMRPTLKTQRRKKEVVEKDEPKTTNARVELGQAFGTKKSQKAIKALTENAIATPGSKRNADGKLILDESASVILNTLEESSKSIPSRADMQAESDASKPRPKANLETEELDEVYPFEELVGNGVLRSIDTRAWTKAFEEKTDIATTSQFVSRNLSRVLRSGKSQQIKALRSLLVMIQWYKCLRPAGQKKKKLPNREEMAKHVPDVDDTVLNQMRQNFAPNVQLNGWDVDFLITSICAMTIMLDVNHETDIYYVCEDLGLELRQATQYFNEIGCRVNPMNEIQRSKTKITKQAAAAHKIARLKLPLEFPKPRLPKAKR